MMKIKRYDQLNENKRLDNILDKLSRFGYKNLTVDEINYLKDQDSPIKSEYNELIIRLLNDYKDGEVNADEFKKFVDKFISKDDLSEFIIQLYDNNLLNSILKL